MGYKAVLFDMDGTLLDTLEDLRDSTNHVLRQMGYPERSLEEMRRFVGNGAEMQIRRAVPEGTIPDLHRKRHSEADCKSRAGGNERGEHQKGTDGIPRVL